MYPNRLEIINKYFNLYNPKVLVHSHSRGYDEYKKPDQEKVIFGNELYDNLVIRDGKIDNSDMHYRHWYIDVNVTHGHSSIKKNVINDVKFTGHMAGEDCLFFKKNNFKIWQKR